MRNFFLLFFLVPLVACQTIPDQRHGAFTPRQIAVLKQQDFEQAGENWQFGMADRLLFATDESKLISKQEIAIGQIATVLAEVGIRGARVEGHTDSIGKASYNENLSTQRAQAVADALIRGGMASAAMQVVGMAARVPIESNRSAKGRRENRRVVIIVSPAVVGDTVGN